MTEFTNVEAPLVEFIVKREAARKLKEAGAPAPWSDDPLIGPYRFCNVNVQADRVSRAIFDTFTKPYAGHPGLIVALTVCRFTNEPEVFEAVKDCLVPFNAERFVAIMKDRAARGLSLARRAYIIPGGKKGELKAKSLTEELFIPLASAAEQIQPRPGDTIAAVFNRLSGVKYMGKGFIRAQIVRDLKQVEPLRSASDYAAFVWSGPGSRQCLDVLHGYSVEEAIKREKARSASWSDRDELKWRKQFQELVNRAAPQIAEHGIEIEDAQSWQNCCCETFKLLKYRSGNFNGARKYTLSGTAPKPRPKSKPVPDPEAAPAEVKPKPEEPKPEQAAPSYTQALRSYQRTFAFVARPYIIAGTAKSAGMRLVFDAETDGLLEDATKVHCIVVGDLDSEHIDAYGPDRIPAALERLAGASYLAGHNVTGFDLPLCKRLYGWAPATATVIVDTLVASRLILPHLDDLDDQAVAMSKFTGLGKLRGRYGLDAWGLRLGMQKIGAEIDYWAEWTPEIQERCVGDVHLTKRLWRFLQPDGQSPRALELEHRTAEICNKITAAGMPFDAVTAERLGDRWEVRCAELEARLLKQFPNLKPTSRKQIGELLEERGWKPERRTEKTGQPSIDDEVLESLPALYPEFDGLAEYLILRRRLGQLTNGKQALLCNVAPDGCVHGGLIHIGTPHSRAKHLQPNMAQVPNPKKGSPFAAEFRELFRHPAWLTVTCDQGNLQDRCFAHYLADYDGGAYAQTFVDGVDQHWKTAQALDLIADADERDKASKLHTAIREGSKRFRYAFLYGAGGARLGHITNDIVRAVQHLDADSDLRQRILDGINHPTEATLKRIGRDKREQFIKATPGLTELGGRLKAQFRRHPWLQGLDARRVPGGADYKCLNRIVTSAEAIICKRWLVDLYDELRERFRYGWAGDVVITAWIHDEIVCCCRPELAEEIGEAMVRHAKAAGEPYGLDVPLDAESRIGRDWAGTPLDAPPTTDPDEPQNEAVDVDAGDIPLDDDEPGEDELQPGFGVDDVGSDGDHEHDQASDGVGLGAGVAQDAPTPHPPPLPPWEKEAPPRPKGNGRTQYGFGADGGKFPCPFHDDSTPSLQLYIDEDDPHYHCFGCGAHGPLSDLPDELIEASGNGAQNGGQREQAGDAESLAYALRLWAEGRPIGDNLAERYLLEVRGIDVDALPPDIDRVLRFHPACPFNGGERKPCLIALFRDVVTDELAGIHRIALTPDGQKVGRQMLGRWPTPRAIKLWPAGKKLYLAEGIETALAAATWLTYHGVAMQPAWAAGSSGSMAKLPIIPGVEELILLVDRGTVGEEAAAACGRTWKAAGLRARALRPQNPELTDFNDLVHVKAKGAK